MQRTVALPAIGPSRLVVHRVTARTDREQVLHLAVPDGSFRLRGRVGRTLRLRASAAPDRLEVEVDTPRPTVVQVWNGWIEDGTDRARSGEAGMVVERSGAGWLLQCSDGVAPADFTDLVVLLQITARATPVIDLRPAATAADRPTR